MDRNSSTQTRKRTAIETGNATFNSKLKKMVIKMGENKFNKAIVNTVDEELKKIFGETATLIIYGYLKSNLSLK